MIALFDLILVLASLVAAVIVLILNNNKQANQIRFPLVALCVFSASYGIFLFIEWDGISVSFDQYEDLLGALIPMLWSFVIYALIQQQSNEDLFISEERFDLAIKGTQAGLWDWYVQTGELIINERWADIIGYTREELHPISIETWNSLVHPEDLERSNTLIKKHISKEIAFYECEVRMQHKNGEWVWVSDRGMITEWDDISGKALRMTGTHLDITEKKKIQFDLKRQMDENIALNEEYLVQNEELSHALENLRSANIELEHARLKAEQSDRLKTAFLANVSHEIRTPMNAIIGFSDMLTLPQLSDEKRRYFAGLVSDSGKQLLSVVNDILDISRLESGTAQAVKERFLLTTVLDSIIENWESRIKAKGLSFFIENKTDAAFELYTDKTRFQQIIENLVSNACKFTERGFVTIECLVIDNALQIQVEDTGIGIESSASELIFEPFRQVELGTTRQYGGTGLGLAISKRLAELLEGNLWFDSELKKGTCFYLTIPLPQ